MNGVLCIRTRRTKLQNPLNPSLEYSSTPYSMPNCHPQLPHCLPWSPSPPYRLPITVSARPQSLSTSPNPSSTSLEPQETLLPSCVPRSNFFPPTHNHPPSSVLHYKHRFCQFHLPSLYSPLCHYPIHCRCEIIKFCSFDNPPPSQMIAFPR